MKISRVRMGPAIAAVALVALPSVAGESWPRFRGPNGAGYATPGVFPSEWGPDHQLWQTTLPGEGHSSPVVWEDILIAQCADPDNAGQWIVCLNTRDGAIEWQKLFPHRTYPKHKRSGYATSTPAIDADFIFVAWGSPEGCTLTALTHEGVTVWQQSLPPFFGRHGFGSSPTIVGELVILPLIHGGEKSSNPDEAESFIAAYDRRTGDLRWKLPRGNCTTSYSAPCVRQTADGRSQLVACSTADGMFGIDLETGRPEWSVPVFEKRVVSSPVIAGPLVLATTGSGAGSGNYVVAVKPGEADSLAREVYRVRDAAPYVPTPIVHGDHAFLWSDKGVVSCIRTADGGQVFRRRVGGSYSASPILVGDRIFAIADDGKVVAIAAAEEFEILGRNDLGELSRATPAAAGGKLFLRTLTRITCIGTPEPAPAAASPAANGGKEPTEALDEAVAALRRGDLPRAIEITDTILQEHTGNPAALTVRVAALERVGRLKEALRDCNQLLEHVPQRASVWDQRGAIRFKLGDVAGSLADFDRAIELEPARAQRHWQRGISCYYLGRYQDGMEQFQKYQTYDGSDVENIAWKFLCEARCKDIAAARQNMMQLTDDDRRVPMMQIDALFRGSTEPDAVMSAAREGVVDDRARRYREFYAHLYLGLYYEAIGKPDLAGHHIQAAAALPNDHYMWNVAEVHARRLKSQAGRDDAGTPASP